MIRAGCEGIHGNPESGNHLAPPISVENYLPIPNTYLTKCEEGGIDGPVAKAQQEHVRSAKQTAHPHPTWMYKTFDSPICNPMCMIVARNCWPTLARL